MAELNHRGPFQGKLSEDKNAQFVFRIVDQTACVIANRFDGMKLNEDGEKSASFFHLHHLRAFPPLAFLNQ